MNKPVLFSVIVPAYNLGSYIDAAAASVLNQSFSDYELILVNDGSEDDTEERCERISRQNPKTVRYLKNDHSGVSAARNSGLAEAAGEYVTFLDGDDLFYPGIMEAVSQVIIREHPDLLYYDFSRGEAAACGIVSAAAGPDYRIESGEQTAWKKIREKTIPCFACFYKKEVLEKNRIMFDTEQFYVEDALFFFRALYASGKIIYYPRTGYHYIQRENSATHLAEYTVEIAGNEYLGWKKIGKYLTGPKEVRHLYRKRMNRAWRVYMRKKGGEFLSALFPVKRE